MTTVIVWIQVTNLALQLVPMDGQSLAFILILNVECNCHMMYENTPRLLGQLDLCGL